MDSLEFLFYLGVSIWFATSILSSSFYAAYIPEHILRTIRLLSILLVLLSEVRIRIDIKQITAVLVIAIFAVCYLIADKSLSYIEQLAIIFVARRYQPTRTLSVVLYVISSVFLLIVLSSQLGIIEDYISITLLRTRHYLGFTYALIPSQLAFQITCIVLYLKKSRCTLGIAISLCLFNYIVYCFTVSRLSFYLSIVLIVFIYLYNVFLKLNNREPKLSSHLLLLVPVFIYCCLLSLVFTLKYNPGSHFMVSLNTFLGNRLSLGLNAITNYGIPLLGQKISFIGNGLSATGSINLSGYYNYVDSTFILSLVNYGIIFLSLFLVLNTLMMLFIFKRNDFYLFSIMTAIAFHMVIDDLSIRLQYNIFLIFISIILIPLTSNYLFKKKSARSSS